MEGLRRTAGVIDAVNRAVGRWVAWLAVAMVLLELGVVVGRYIFGVGSIKVQETLLYANALLFLLAAAWTLLEDGHVRVDVYYLGASPRRKALVNLAGAVVFLIPVSILLVWAAWPYVASAWEVRERSREASGLPAVFLLKTAIIVFAVQIGLQGVSLALRSAWRCGAMRPN